MQQMYITRFPQHIQRIQKAFEAATDEQGYEVFGNQPWARFKEEWGNLPSRIVMKMLCQLAERQTDA